MSEGDVSFEGRLLDRRTVMKGIGAGGLALAGAELLAACGGSGGSSSSSGSQTAATETSSATQTSFAGNVGTPPNPSKGGTLRVAMTGNGTAENYNPYITTSPIDTLHCCSVFDPMTRPAPYGRRAPGLVVEWSPNKDATVWDLRLRPGVTWHDGKPLTADDLIYTLQTMGTPMSFGAAAVANVKLKELQKMDALTVRVPLALPIADLQGYFFYTNTTYVVQNGTKNYTKPIGTGAWKLESFVPGQRSVLSANRDYWDQPKPYPDELQIISIDDATARLNALTGNQIDLAIGLSYEQASANLHSTQFKVVVGARADSALIYMRCDTAPFNDVRVRQAMRLLADRPQLVEIALSGIGAVGNDLECQNVEYYASNLPQRTQDIEQAKSLLKAAGQSDLRVTLHTAEVAPGFTEAATAYAQQAAAGGVTVQVKVEQPSQYFNPSVLYLKESFAQDIWPGPSLVNNYSQQFLKSSPLNETHFYDPTFEKLFLQAQAELNPAKARELWYEVQKIQWDQGGGIVWAFNRGTAAASPRVRGYGEPGSGWYYSNDDLQSWNWGLA